MSDIKKLFVEFIQDILKDDPKNSKSFPIKRETPENRRFLQLRVLLRGVVPSVWRSFVVPSDFTFYDLHEILQIIMDWKNNYLYEFIVKDGTRYRTLSSLKDNISYCTNDEAANYDLSYLKREGMKCKYTYNLGDSWVHEIVVQNLDYKSTSKQLVFILSGERKAPPEDCGGIYGYYDIIDAIEEQDKDNELLEKFGKYDPEYFPIDLYNTKLAAMFGENEKAEQSNVANNKNTKKTVTKKDAAKKSTKE
ncbi:MAG: plasmid pRiA4b ORF-3 family protein [Planctomycetaceae bacterium]|jgi:hypothetical protein|nr:plasmid pRiA4b ORF-3 family protein [Planctomycetaceae bacterium]